MPYITYLPPQRRPETRISAFAAMALAMLLAVSAAAEEQKAAQQLPGDFSVSFALTSDYVLRGISQNDEHPAPQASLDYVHHSGLYAGVWASAVDFNNGTDAEIDFYTGYTRSYDKLTGDLRFYYYLYPGAPTGTHYDFFETYAALTYAWDVVSVQTSLNASPEGFNRSGNTYYPKLTATIPMLDYAVTFDAHVARLEAEDNTRYGFPDYNEWGLGATYSTKWVDIRAEYIDTNMNRTACASGCSARGVLTLLHKFPFTL